MTDTFKFTEEDYQKMAVIFKRLLLAEVGEKNFESIFLLNDQEADPRICHSHDYCDANVVMAQAFSEVFGFDVDSQNEGHADVWNAAWDLAKRTMVASSRPINDNELRATRNVVYG